MRNIVIVFIFIFFHGLVFSNYEKAIFLYKQAMLMRKKGNLSSAIDYYYKAIKEDREILKFKDGGLYNLLVKKIKNTGDFFSVGELYYFFGEFDKALLFFNKALIQYNNDSQKIIAIKGYIKIINNLKNNKSSNKSSRSVNKYFSLDNSKKNNTFKNKEDKKIVLLKKISNLKKELKNLELKLKEQKKLKDDFKEVHNTWFNIFYSTNETPDIENTAFNLEQYYKLQYDRELEKYNSIKSRIENINKRLENLEKELNQLSKGKQNVN